MNGNSIVIGFEFNAAYDNYQYSEYGFGNYAGQDLAVLYCSVATPSPHNLSGPSGAMARGPNAVPPSADLPDPSSCFSNASLWFGGNLRGVASGQAERDLKVLAHPTFGRLLVDAESTYGYGATAPSSAALTLYACPYFTAGGAGSLNAQNCSDNGGSSPSANWAAIVLDQDTTGTGQFSAASLAATTEYRGPSAFPDEATAYTMVTYAHQGSNASWMMQVCPGAADPTFARPWPCANDSGWTSFALAPLLRPPLASSIQVVGSDIVVMLLEQDTLSMATCPLGFACDTPSAWTLATVLASSNLAGFAPGFSSDRSVSFFAGVNGSIIVDHSLAGPSGANTFLMSRLGGGFGRMAQGP
jgi:hypothetical protein